MEFSSLASSNIYPENATANGHDFQMFSFEDTASCKACQMLLRWESGRRDLVAGVGCPFLFGVGDSPGHHAPELGVGRLSFDLQLGERASIVGPNGCGKSTLLKILAGLEDYDKGVVVINKGATARDVGASLTIDGAIGKVLSQI